MWNHFNTVSITNIYSAFLLLECHWWDFQNQWKPPNQKINSDTLLHLLFSSQEKIYNSVSKSWKFVTICILICFCFGVYSWWLTGLTLYSFFMNHSSQNSRSYEEPKIKPVLVSCTISTIPVVRLLCLIAFHCQKSKENEFLLCPKNSGFNNFKFPPSKFIPSSTENKGMYDLSLWSISWIFKTPHSLLWWNFTQTSKTKPATMNFSTLPKRMIMKSSFS